MSDAESYRRAGALFDRLVALEAPARAALLAQAARETPEVAALAQRMLRADRVDRAGRAGADPAAGVDQESDPLGVLDARLGPYRIEELIGRGGMGAVYRARRQQPDVDVAVKFVSVSDVGVEVALRFQREADLLARLDHVGIVRYIASGSDRGRPYLVMEYLPGEDLSPTTSVIAAGVRQTVSVLLEVAEAVAYLHDSGVLHRDIKPSNILWVERLGRTRPVLVDFGIARALDPVDSDSMPTAAPIGTPQFMSPEQRVAAGSLDVRADVYGLGAVLHTLLVGCPPSVVPMKVEGGAIAPSARSPAASASVRPDVFDDAGQRARSIDRDLDAIVAKAMAFARVDRYQTVRHFIADLQRWRDGYPVAARRVRPVERLRKLIVRRPFQSGLVAALVIVSLLAAAAFLRGLSREREVLADLRRQVALNERTLEFFSKTLFVPALPGRGGPDTPIVDVLRVAAAGLHEDGGVREPELLVTIGLGLLGVFNSLDMPKEARSVADKTSELAEQLAPRQAIRIRFDLERARMLVLHQDSGAARDVAEALWERLSGPLPDSPEALQLLRQARSRAAQIVGTTLEAEGRYDQARSWFELGLDALGSDPEPRSRRYLQHGLAVAAMESGHHDEAIRRFEELLPEMERLAGEDRMETFAVLSNLARLFRQVGEHDQAMAYGQRSLALGEELLPPTHAHLLVARSNLLVAAAAAGHHRRAVELGAANLVAIAERDDTGAEDVDWAVERVLESLRALDLTAADVDLTADAVAAVASARGLEGNATARVRVFHALAHRAAGADVAARAEVERALRSLPADAHERELARRLRTELGTVEDR